MTRKARRQVLDNVRLSSVRHPHAGLWLDKFLREQVPQGGEGSFRGHFADVADIPIVSDYEAFFKRWKTMLETAGAQLAVAHTKGRLAVGLGAASVLENSIAIHHTYGVPYIPGSALKGLAAHYASSRLEDERWRRLKGGEAHRIVFGDTEWAGYVNFFDALYVPKSAPRNKPLELDVTAVHHPYYYRGENFAPADWDSPTPISFVSARGDYLVALHGPDEWVETAFQVLALAFEEYGIGAKTSSGYGRMELEISGAQEEETHSETKPEESGEVERFRQQLASMATKDVAGQIHSVYQAWKNLEASLEVKKAIAQAILDKIEEAKRTKKTSKKAWYQELVAYVKGASAGDE
jgi:CRISPR-associated protein Cmr6